MKTLARLLWDARQSGFTLAREELGAIGDLGAAYAVQALQVPYSGLEIGGWKLGATARPVMELTGLEAPFSAPMFTDHIARAGADVGVFPANNPHIETEVCLKLGSRLPPRPEPYTRAEAAEAVDSAWASFEVVGFRVEGGPKDAGLMLVADGGVNAGAVVGDEIPLAALAGGLDVTVRKNGESAAAATTDDTLWEDHLDALIWLAARQDQLPRQLRPGDLALTGTVAGLIPGAPGDRFEADFGGIAQVDVKLTEA